MGQFAKARRGLAYAVRIDLYRIWSKFVHLNWQLGLFTPGHNIVAPQSLYGMISIIGPILWVNLLRAAEVWPMQFASTYVV